jgi:hypothetical protein
MRIGLNRYAVFVAARTFQRLHRAVINSSSPLSIESSRAKAWIGCLQQIPFRKGASHDIPSATHD